MKPKYLLEIIMPTAILLTCAGMAHAKMSEVTQFTATSVYKQDVLGPNVVVMPYELSEGKSGGGAFFIKITNPNPFSTTARIGFTAARDKKGGSGTMKNGTSTLNVKLKENTGWSANEMYMDSTNPVKSKEYDGALFVIDGDQQLVAGVYSVDMSGYLWTY